MFGGGMGGGWHGRGGPGGHMAGRFDSDDGRVTTDGRIPIFNGKGARSPCKTDL